MLSLGMVEKFYTKQFPVSSFFVIEELFVAYVKLISSFFCYLLKAIQFSEQDNVLYNSIYFAGFSTKLNWNRAFLTHENLKKFMSKAIWVLLHQGYLTLKFYS